MNKLNDYLYGQEIEFGNKHDVTRLKNAIPQLATVPDALVAKMYSDYSDMYAAGWMMVDAEEIENFKRWLL